MEFDFETAVKVRQHYRPILVGMPLTDDYNNDSNWKIDGVFICRKGGVNQALDFLSKCDYDDKFPLIEVKDRTTKDFQIYVFTYTGVDVFYHELDKNLTEKGIEKIY
jgi:hypothetical protein